MAWLRDHVYIAAWLSPVIALLGMVVKNVTTGTTDTQWSMIMIYVAFLTCLAAVFTPLIDDSARFFAGFGTFALGIFIAVHAFAEAEQRWKSKNPS
jgi:hypothetical protein